MFLFRSLASPPLMAPLRTRASAAALTTHATAARVCSSSTAPAAAEAARRPASKVQPRSPARGKASPKASPKASSPTKRTAAAAVAAQGSPTAKSGDRAAAAAASKAVKVPRAAAATTTTTATADHDDSGGVPAAVVAEACQRIEEDDVRLTMRMLMSQHFSRNYSMKQPEEAKLEEEREALRRRQEPGLRRIEQKNRNSARLLAGDAGAVGDGILPFFARPSSNPYETDNSDGLGGGSGAAPTGWRALNPVGLDNLDDGDGSGGEAAAPLHSSDYIDILGGEPVSLSSLTQPDLSVYDNSHDYRMRSDQALALGQGPAPSGAGAGDGSLAGSSPSSRDGLSGGGLADMSADGGWALPADGRRAVALLRTELQAEDEDADFSVSLYGSDDTDL